MFTQPKYCCCPVNNLFKKRRSTLDCRGFYTYKRFCMISKMHILILLTLSLSSVKTETLESTQVYCDSLPNLQAHQRTFCYNNIDIVKTLEEGYKLGHKACEAAFKDSGKTGTRWNCTNMLDEEKKNVFFGVFLARRKCIKIIFVFLYNLH